MPLRFYSRLFVAARPLQVPRITRLKFREERFELIVCALDDKLRGAIYRFFGAVIITVRGCTVGM
jgi:hypothetical protein